MRITVTLDPDVAAKLKAVARQRGVSFEQALNQAVRDGLAAGRCAERPFRLYTQPMGLRPSVSVDKASRLAAALEDDEIVGKLDLRK
jgi:ribbon-helix-helix CopG family protein